MEPNSWVEIINEYGFPITASSGMGYLVYYVWTWATTNIKPVLVETHDILIDLVDRIRVLDGDILKLNTKVNTIIQLRGQLLEQEKNEHLLKPKKSKPFDD
jgi:hypothetical protein